MAVLHQAVLFFLLMMLGIYARKKVWITPENQGQLSAIVVNIAYPAIILTAARAEGGRIAGDALLEALGVALGVIALAWIGGVILAAGLGFERRLRGVVIVMTLFTNIGFMGVPMVRGIYGGEALIYMTVFLIPFNLFFFSYAVRAIRAKPAAVEGNDERAEEKTAEAAFDLTRLLRSSRALFNNGMIACFLAVILYFTELPIPFVIADAVNMMGATTAPLAMLLMGSFLVDVDWKAALVEKRIWVYAVLKMILLPVAAVRVLGFFVQNELIVGVAMAALATPCGNVIALLAAMYNREAYPTAVKCIAFTTVASVATMPVAFWLGGLI